MNALRTTKIMLIESRAAFQNQKKHVKNPPIQIKTMSEWKNKQTNNIDGIASLMWCAHQTSALTWSATREVYVPCDFDCN